MNVKRKGRKPINTEALDWIEKQKKKTFTLTRDMWRLATPPGAHILRKKLGMEFKVQSLIDNSGWILTKK